MRHAQDFPDGVIECAIADELRDHPLVCEECGASTDNPVVKIIDEHGFSNPSGWEWEAKVALYCPECPEYEVRTFGDEGF